MIIKHIVFLNDKPIEQATIEDLKQLNERVAQAFKDYIGLDLHPKNVEQLEKGVKRYE